MTRTRVGDELLAESLDLPALARDVRAFAGVHAKAAIGVVSEIFGGSDWLSGPGDDGAAVPFGDSFVIACGEALLPSFVQHDPFGSGIAAVLTNINDLAAMGARPLGIVDTIVADEDTAREILLGVRHGCELYGVPLLGGHLTRHEGPPALSAFGVGRADNVLSVTNVAVGQTLVLACAVEGQLRADFPFFRGFDERGERAPGDIAVLADIADSGACVAAKDVSMAGLVGSLAMLLEHGRFGCVVDLDAVPRPEAVPIGQWLTCFPSFAFLLCCPTDRVGECQEAFRVRGLVAEPIGIIDGSGTVALRSGEQTVEVFDLSTEGITGLQ
jgi:hypothetical protein